MNRKSWCSIVSAVAIAVLVASPAVFAADDGAPLKRTAQHTATPSHVWYNGHKIKVAERIPADDGAPRALEIGRLLNKQKDGQTHSDGLRAPLDATYTFYEQQNTGFYDSSGQSWGSWYDFQLPPGGIPVVTEIYLAGLVNAQPEDTGATYDPSIGLVELYEDYDENVSPGVPVHGGWLGGLACSFGPLVPTEQSGGGYFQADPGFFFFTTGDNVPGPDGLPRKFISYETGTIQNVGGFDRFISFAGQDNTLAYTFGFGDGTEPLVGNTRDSFLIDGYGAGAPGDRIYLRADGFLWYGQPSRLGLGIYGELSFDCNCDNFADGDQVACGDEIGFPACETGSCTFGLDCVTTAGLFCDPFGIGYVVDAACDVSPNNDIPDLCDNYDCNSNGILDGDEIAAGSATDCDGNNIPDECQINKDSTAPGGPFYCDPNGVGCAAICDADCDNNGIVDVCDIVTPPTYPEDSFYADCNNNFKPDGCEIVAGTSTDCDENGVLDKCERPIVFDCDKNGVEDACDLYAGLANDYDANGIPDSCPGTVCNTRWDGFEAAYGYVANQTVDGFDSDGDGDVWSEAGDTGAWRPVGCPSTSAGQSFKQTIRVSHFTNSEFFVSAGGTAPPKPATAMSLEFDFKYDGAYNADRDQNLWLVDQTGNETATVLRFSTTVTDTNTNAPGDPADDATPGWLWVFDPDANGGDGAWVDLVGPFSAATNCWHAIVDFDAVAQKVSVCIDTHGDGGFGGPVCKNNMSVNEGTIQRIDWFQEGSSAAIPGNPPGNPPAGVRFDNFYVCETGGGIDCSQYLRADGTPDTDCDNNSVCDSFELEGHDRNHNGILDYCEGFCGDCNNNWIPDAFEIARGSAADVNSNDIPDVCEQLDHSTSFEAAEGFTAGELDGDGYYNGMDGWVNRIRGLVTIENVASSTYGYAGMPTDGTQWLRIQEDPDAQGPTYVFSPRLDAAGDGDIEKWSWDQLITQNGFTSMFVEIGDLCEDFARPVTGDGSYIFLDAFIAGDGSLGEVANTGFEFRGDGNTYAPPAIGTAELLMLEDAGQRLYGTTSAGDIAGGFGSVKSAEIDIMNTRGETAGFYDGAQINLAGVSETQGSYVPNPTGCPSISVRKGGDRQMWIRVDGYGDNAPEFWFDNIKYETFADCDYDGYPDVDWLDPSNPVGGPAFDQNGDGIPDACQDCDNDCPASYPLSAGDVGCLDPCEIDANAPGCNGMGGGESDANNNGIPDSCDINSDLPYIAMFDYPNCNCFGNIDNEWDAADGHCFFTRLGGGSCDADSNGVPDDAQIAGGAADCNGNGCVDLGEIANGTVEDLNGNDVPDECEVDCNHNGQPDWKDLEGADPVSEDVQPGYPVGDGIPDECCLSTPGGDLDGDGDVDLDDYSFMQDCAGIVAGAASTDGSGVCTGCECGCADLNEDGTVDGLDAQLFFLVVTGPQ